MICRHCAHRTSTRLASGDAFTHCPVCGCPSALPLNHPAVLSGRRRAGDILPPPLMTFSSVSVSVNGVRLEEARVTLAHSRH